MEPIVRYPIQWSFRLYLILLPMLCLCISEVVWAQQPAMIPMDASASALVELKAVSNSEPVLYIFDLEQYLARKPNNKIWQYDVLNIVSALQGLVNRKEPLLYIFYVREQLSGHSINVDRFWLEKMRIEGFFKEHRLVEIDTLEELLELFRDYYTFSVLWDPDVPATGNVALTISGADGFLPIRHDNSPDSLFSQVGMLIHAQERLTGRFISVGTIPDTTLDTTKSKKNDAYIWAKARYLDSGSSSNTYLANFLDPYDWDARAGGVQYPDLQNCMIVNHDYYIAKKAFFMDLDPWWDEVPTDIPDDPFMQAVDLRSLMQILESAYQNTPEGEHILKIGGFVPWWVKYSTYNKNVRAKHNYTETVEEFISILSAYNGVIDGGGHPFTALANASVYQHVPVQDRYFQNPVPPQIPLENRNYILFVIGDFSSSSLLYQTMPTLWENTFRGIIPIAWAISPLLSERVPHVFDYLYRTRTSLDYFVSGSAGAGLCFPNRYVPPRQHSKLDNGLYFWEKLSKELYQKFDLKITTAANLDRENLGVSIFTEDLQRHFKSFSMQGVATLNKPYAQPLVDGVVPFLMETGNQLNNMLNLSEVAQSIHKNSKTDRPVFHLYRFNLADPTGLYYLLQTLQHEHPEFKYQALDPYTFFFLLRQHISGDPASNYYIPTFLSHTIPLEMERDKPYLADITLRNDGWDTWTPAGTPVDRRYRVIYYWQYEGSDEIIPGGVARYIEKPVLPGETITLKTSIQTPALLSGVDAGGLYNLILQLEQENVRKSAIEERVRVTVR